MTFRLRPSARPIALALALVALSGLVGGCSAMHVQPWDRDLLARDAMKINPSLIESGADDHIYFSKEGSTGGHGVGGGGCGCN